MQAPCGCNQNYYDQVHYLSPLISDVQTQFTILYRGPWLIFFLSCSQMVECLRCQSSSSATYSVKDLEGYKLVCTSFGETWKEIHIPDQTTTSTTTLPTTTTTLSPVPSNGSSSGGTSTSTNHLSSGAIAGIVVSVVALVVALSVAGYVWRRRRENLQHRTNDEYKYSDSQRDSYMEVALPQYTGMIQPTLPPIAKVS